MIKIIINNDEIRQIKNLGVFTKQRKPIIIFGETHGFIDDLSVQKEILKELDVEYYLYEMLEETNLITDKQKDDFLEKPNEKDFSVISKYGELKSVVKMGKELKLKLIGCDIKDMCRKDKIFLTKTDLSPKEIEIEGDILKRREKKQAEKILEYYMKSKKIVFASLGAFHLRKESYIFDFLKERLVMVCYPTYKDRVAFSPEENMKEEDINYVIEIKDFK